MTPIEAYELLEEICNIAVKGGMFTTISAAAKVVQALSVLKPAGMPEKKEVPNGK